MNSCVIFCAADFDSLLVPVPADTLVIAADGGLRHVEDLGLTPHVILGDFDSLGYVPTGSQVHPVEKDDTDSMLAIRLGLARGCTEFFLYGAMDGPRLDHTMANFQALAYLAAHNARGWLVGRNYVVTVASGEILRFPANASGILSMFCLGGEATVSIEGLHYPLQSGKLTPDFPLGVSNHFTGQAASVTVEDGLVLVMWDRHNGLCQRGVLC